MKKSILLLLIPFFIIQVIAQPTNIYSDSNNYDDPNFFSNSDFDIKQVPPEYIHKVPVSKLEYAELSSNQRQKMTVEQISANLDKIDNLAIDVSKNRAELAFYKKYGITINLGKGANLIGGKYITSHNKQDSVSIDEIKTIANEVMIQIEDGGNILIIKDKKSKKEIKLPVDGSYTFISIGPSNVILQDGNSVGVDGKLSSKNGVPYVKSGDSLKINGATIIKPVDNIKIHFDLDNFPPTDQNEIQPESVTFYKGGMVGARSTKGMYLEVDGMIDTQGKKRQFYLQTSQGKDAIIIIDKPIELNNQVLKKGMAKNDKVGELQEKINAYITKINDDEELLNKLELDEPITKLVEDKWFGAKTEDALKTVQQYLVITGQMPELIDGESTVNGIFDETSNLVSSVEFKQGFIRLVESNIVYDNGNMYENLIYTKHIITSNLHPALNINFNGPINSKLNDYLNEYKSKNKEIKTLQDMINALYMDKTSQERYKFANELGIDLSELEKSKNRDLDLIEYLGGTSIVKDDISETSKNSKSITKPVIRSSTRDMTSIKLKEGIIQGHKLNDDGKIMVWGDNIPRNYKILNYGAILIEGLGKIDIDKNEDLIKYSEINGIDSDLTKSVVYIESRGYVGLIEGNTKYGCTGVMQLRPYFAEDWQKILEKSGINEQLNPLNPTHSIAVGTGKMGQLFNSVKKKYPELSGDEFLVKALKGYGNSESYARSVVDEYNKRKDSN